MAGEQKNIDAIANVMDNGVDTFLEGVEKSQVGIFNKVLASVKGLELDVNGNVKQTVSNLRILNAVRKSVENEVLNEAYIKRVGTFTNQYPAIQSLNNDYFGSIEAAFEPNRELYNQIVSKSIQTTKASLLDSGINENVINPIVRIVDDSVTTGAAYADMVDELRTIIKGDPERLGNLLRYSKQITTDALNQFNGIYNETIASDLDLEWYYYSGAKRRTSRPFCKKYAGKYFHKKEVEDFGRKKDLDGSNLCGGSSKTDLCQGRIPGTNSSSIFRFRAGYNCRHVYKPTTIAAVPKNVIDRNIKKGYFVPVNDEDVGIDDEVDTKDIDEPTKKTTKAPVKKPIQKKKVEAAKPKQSTKPRSSFEEKTNKYLNTNLDTKTQFKVKLGKKFISDDKFAGASQGSLDDISRAFDDVLGKYNVKLNTIGHTVKGRANGIYSPTTKGLALQKTYLNNSKKISKETREAFAFQNDRNIIKAKKAVKSSKSSADILAAKERLNLLELTKQWSISSVSESPIYTTAVHESFHAVSDKYGLTSGGNNSVFANLLKKNKVTQIDRASISEYALSNDDEFFSEIGASLANGMKIPSNVESAFKETLKTIQ